MFKLDSPYGIIDIKIDGISVPYVALEGAPKEVLFPNILKRYQIKVHFVPDGKKHDISCTFSPVNNYKISSSSDEYMNCQSFYNDQRIAMSIAVQTEPVPEDYDYNTQYLENGIAYLILEDTKTNQYPFGIAWIDDAGYDDPVNDEEYRILQVNDAADPTFSL